MKRTTGMWVTAVATLVGSMATASTAMMREASADAGQGRPQMGAEEFKETWRGVWDNDETIGVLIVREGAGATPEIGYCYDTRCSRPEFLHDGRVEERTLKFKWDGEFAGDQQEEILATCMQAKGYAVVDGE